MLRPADLEASPAVEAHHVVKRYRLGEHVTLGRTVRALVPGLRSPLPTIEAVADVSLAVNRGECFGIVGLNGSGKSTLVQMIAGTTLPTRGRFTVRGRVLPLLSVGSGFHPELTGTENVRLFGAILGIETSAVDGRLDEIASFAEVERHMDTPVKRYSDGMKARLSFATGMLFPADVYVFDEVLAVVDGEFLDRCLEAIAGLVGHGRTVIYVSHSNEQIRQLCDRVMWMKEGRVQALGATDQVLPLYIEERAAHAVGSRLTGFTAGARAAVSRS
jgi:lipopolysaccharide transport system ATP-binding protein